MQLTDEERELLYEQLSRHAAEDRLTVEELERRVAVVAEAQTREEAQEALAGLPALGPGAGGPGGASAGQRARSRGWWGRGHGDASRPQIGWQPTGERFRDPRSGRIMRVWVDAAGARHYVPDE